MLSTCVFVTCLVLLALFVDSCPVGTLDNIGTQTCEPCSAGFHQNQTDQLFCYPCPAGHYQNLRESTFCYPCDFGFYQNETKSDFCYKCPGNKTTFVMDATSISNCSGRSSTVSESMCCFPNNRTISSILLCLQIHVMLGRAKA